MKIPTIKWIPFDSENVPELCPDEIYLILLREDNYDNGKTWSYSVDIACPYGNYLSNFWNTNNDWDEGQIIEVLAYAELPYRLSEEELTDIKEEKTND